MGSSARRVTDKDIKSSSPLTPVARIRSLLSLATFMDDSDGMTVPSTSPPLKRDEI